MQMLHSAGLTLVSFAILISVVVFCHELGHLLVGKAVGVKALRFSIGFGPRLFGFRLGETEYRLSALPLGGYVKFAGDNPLEELPAEDRGRGFLEQPPAKKAAIAFAGPAANFLLALVLYFGLYLGPHRDLSSRVGYVRPGSPAAAAGIHYGDRVVAVDGEQVSSFLALKEKIEAHAGQPLIFSIERDGSLRTARVTPAVHEESNPIETVRQGRIGISPTPRAAQIAVVSPASPAGKAGLRDFDRVVAVDRDPIANFEELALLLAQKAAHGGGARLQLLRKRPVAAPGATLWVEEPLAIDLPLAPAVLDELSRDDAEAATDPIFSLGIESSDLSIFALQRGGPAERAGLMRGDRILAVNGEKVAWWDDVETLRRAAAAAPLDLLVRRGGKQMHITARQGVRKVRDELSGASTDAPDLGASPDLGGVEPERIWVRYGTLEAARHALSDTVGAARQMAIGLYKIATRHISSEVIGGPIMIAGVARKAADEGWQTFVAVMALFSVNLGLFNLIPVPVLDGFHVLSAGIEGVQRRPLSLRFREAANVVGIVLVLGLMLFALRNDVLRLMLLQ